MNREDVIRIAREVADKDKADPVNSQDDMITLTPEELIKFAELIIRECVNVADDYVKDCSCEDHIKCNNPRSIIGIKIKEHFGEMK